MGKNDKSIEILQIIRKRKTERGDTEYRVKWRSDSDNTFLFEPFKWIPGEEITKYCESELKEFEHECAVIRRCNVEVYDKETPPKKFGFERQEMENDLKPIEICDNGMIEVENTLLCLIKWNKPLTPGHESDCTDFVSYYEMIDRHPELVIQYYEKHLYKHV